MAARAFAALPGRRRPDAGSLVQLEIELATRRAQAEGCDDRHRHRAARRRSGVRVLRGRLHAGDDRGRARDGGLDLARAADRDRSRCFLLVALLVLSASAAIKKGTPPLPEQAIEEAKLTAEAVKNGNALMRTPPRARRGAREARRRGRDPARTRSRRRPTSAAGCARICRSRQPVRSGSASSLRAASARPSASCADAHDAAAAELR